MTLTFQSKLLALLGVAASVSAQQACTLNTEGKPSLSWQTCSGANSCTTNNGYLVIDSNWRWTHALSSTTNCYTGNTWNATLCPDDTTCAANCCLDGSGGYQSTYGVSTSGNAATLDFVTKTQYATNVGSRVYLMESDQKNYQMFNLLGKEFTFDVNVANIGCGLNGALYFVSMDQDGGLSKYSSNKAGAAYGTGYCDTQCAMDLKWINGMANVQGWKPSTNDANSGVGGMGSCCNELDIWEANSMSNALTLHSCETEAQHMCNATAGSCGGTYASNRYGGNCDPDGCDWNPYRNGATSFYGPGQTVNTNQVFTVVTQFLTDASGNLANVVRYYVQNGVLIPTPSATNIPGYTGNSINPTYCPLEHSTFGETDYFTQRGGFSSIQTGFEAGMVLVLSLWDDHYSNMLWLDSTYPVGATTPGAARGSCSSSSGVPSDIEGSAGSSNVIYSNIRFGSINSTFTYTSVQGGSPGGGSSSSSSAHQSTTMSTSRVTTTTPHTTTTPPPNGGTQTHWGQCGGSGYQGPTACQAPYACSTLNPYYYQCL